MHCPFCSHEETQVKDSRPSEDGAAIRRRRSCPSCGARFTTFERVQLREINVVKKDGTSQPFDRDKLIKSMQLALRKRPIEIERIERIANSILRQLEASGEHEIAASAIGDMVMEGLAALDKVAYIRYASVYKDFRDPGDFDQFLEALEKLKDDEQSNDNQAA